jgi:hypothetical protein
MNYYIDTEFIEDFEARALHIPSFRWTPSRHYIELISIGIVAEDSREYYAVSKDFDLKHVWNKYDLLNPIEFGGEPEKQYWLRDNVLKPLHEDLCKNISGDMRNSDYFCNLLEFSYRSLKRLIAAYGKTNKQIADEIQLFTANMIPEGLSKNSLQEAIRRNRSYPPAFYGYYADYDWVLFCSLFGRMLDLPRGYPMYCYDLKQLMDDTAGSLGNNDFFTHFHVEQPLTLQEKIELLKKNTRYPACNNEHNSIEDAKWNKQLHLFLKSINNSISSPKTTA